MIGTIRRHQTWLWVVIISLTVVSFVVFGPTNSKIGDALSKGGGEYGLLDGKKITRTQVQNAEKEIEIGYFLSNGQWPRTESSQLLQQAYWRLLINQRQKDYGIQISTETVAATAHRMLGSATLDDFVDKVLKPNGMDANDFDHFLRHELGKDQLISLAGLTGKLVTPTEAEGIYRAEHQDVDSSVVIFSASNYLSKVTVTPDEISKFYTNQMANYRLPDQVQVNYVKFGLSNYMATVQGQLTNLDQMVDSYVQRLGTNLYHGTKTPVESKAAIRAEILRRATVQQAQRAASAFAVQLAGATNLEALATNGMTVQTTAPFDRDFGPSDISVPPDFARKAFALTTDEPYAGPIIPDDTHPVDGVYVIELKKQIPSRTPPYKEIESKVTSDYRYSQAVHLAQEAAIQFHATVTNGMFAGKTFKMICTEGGVKPQPLPPFSLSAGSLPEELQSEINFDLVKKIAFSTPAGKPGPVAGARDGAFILYVDRLLPIDESKFKKEFPAFLAYVRNARQADAFNQWFAGEVRKDPEFYQSVMKLTEDNQSRPGSSRKPRS